jgi:LysR substrate binding domain
MPNVKVKVHDWPVEKNIAGVRDGRLQLAIILPPLKANALDELRFEPLFTGRVCLAVSCDHPLVARRSVSLADAAREPFIGLTRGDYPRYLEYLNAIFARVNDRPRLVEEHDGWSGVFSSVGAGIGVALTSDAFNYAFDDRIKLVRLTPEPKRVAVGIITRKGKLGPAAEKFCQCERSFRRYSLVQSSELLQLCVHGHQFPSARFAELFWFLFGGYQHRGAFVLHEEHDEFRRFGLASVSPDDMNVLRAFIEGLARCQSYFFPAPDLHYDRALQHINKPMCVVAMYWVRAARRILNHEHQTFLARKVRQVFRHELRQLRFLGFRRGGHR